MWRAVFPPLSPWCVQPHAGSHGEERDRSTEKAASGLRSPCPGFAAQNRRVPNTEPIVVKRRDRLGGLLHEYQRAASGRIGALFTLIDHIQRPTPD